MFIFKVDKLSHNSYGKILFDQIDFSVYRRDKIALVGKNGSGKSTLLKAIMGEVEVDGGKVQMVDNIKICYLAQSSDFGKHKTIYDYVLSDSEDMNINKYEADIIFDQIDLNGDWKIEHCSGGQLRRAALSKALMNNPDLLILDEPTNHLDIMGILWLEKYLLALDCSMIFISHDKKFLETVSNRTFYLDRGGLYKNKKGYLHFEAWIDELAQIEQRNMLKAKTHLKLENHWYLYGVTARRKRNQQRLEKLHSLREQVKHSLAKINNKNTKIKFESAANNLYDKLIFDVKNISYKYPNSDQYIIKDFSLRLIKNERLCLVGANGSGKSTLLKILIGQITDFTGGLNTGFAIKTSYFSQNREELDMNKTPREFLCPNGGDRVRVSGGIRHVIGYLKDFLFTKDDTEKVINQLSGGQQNRLLLAKIFADPGNLVILDEPTNDLDFETLELLANMIQEVDACVILVSHDRDFINNVSTRVVSFMGDAKIIDNIGGYADMLPNTQSSKKKNVSKNATDHKQNRQEKLTFNEQQSLLALPKKIKEHERFIEDLEGLITSLDYASNQATYLKTAGVLKQKQKELEKMEEQYLKLLDRE